MVQYIGVGVLSQMVVVLPQKGGRFPDFCAKFIKSFYFYDIIYFAMKISVYHEFEVCLVMDQFQGFQPLVIKIWACILRVGVLPHVTLSANPRYGYFTLMAEWQVSVTLWGCRNELSKTCGWPVCFNFFKIPTCACANLIKTPFTKLLQFMEFMRTDMPSGFECCTWSIGIYRDHGLYQISWYITLSDKIDYFIFLNQPKFKSSTGRVLSGAVAGLAALEYVKQPWNPVPMRTRRSGQLLH